jgi:hypothetical protein
MTEVRPIYTSSSWQSGRLIDIVNHLPPGVVLTASPAFQEIVGRPLGDVSILQACSAVIAAGYQDDDAEIREDTIILYGRGAPSPVFTFQYPDDGRAHRASKQTGTAPKEQGLVPSLLAVDGEQLSKTAPLFSERLGQVLKALDDPMAWLKISNLRLEAQHLSITFKCIDGLLEMLEQQTFERERTANSPAHPEAPYG